MTKKTTSHKPVLAAVFNILIPGLGYLYAGVRQKFAWMLIVASVLSIIAIFDPQSLWYFGSETTPQMTLVENVSLLLVAVAFGYDAYTEAKRLK